MPVWKGLEGTFDTVASAYEKLRPGYPEELYQTIFHYIPIREDSKVAEVGSGSGQATARMLTTGCQLTAVEYGEYFSRLLQEKFQDDPNFSVIHGKFEDAVLEKNAFDLVFSATAFHWVPEKVGYEKVFSLLKSEGVFARFANHPYPAKDNPALAQEIDALYEQYYNKYYQKPRKTNLEYTKEQAKALAMVAGKYGFTDLQYWLFDRQRRFSANKYIKLLGTYSDHIAMEESIRTEFFAKIQQAIQNHGGTITVYDRIDLQLARKPSFSVD